MKKKVLAIILCAVMLLAAAAGFAGCKSTSRYVGNWEMSRMKYMGMEINMSEYTGGDMDFNIELKADGTAVFSLNGDEETGNWEKTGENVKLTSNASDEELELTLDKKTGELCINYQGAEIYFKRK